MSRVNAFGILAYQGNLIKKLQFENNSLNIENLKLREELSRLFKENKQLRAKVRHYEGT